jgi:hypothetical protein
MTNDKCPMTKEFLMTNDETARRTQRLFSSFGLRHYFVIRHLSFVIIP